ncbi:MAG TPA: ABC transporter substrate-binding protein, partial [Denitromonas sp.]|nr:ABC transporter substrate-binding protein [Denitromonas sp.]
KGLSGMATKEEDVITTLFVANTHTQLLFFTTDGMVYKLKTWRLPQGGRTSKGKAIINILPIPQGVSIAAIMPVDAPEEDWDNLQIFFATSTGDVRRNALSDFTNVKSNGKIAMKLPEGVELVNARICTEDDDIMLVTASGYSAQTHELGGAAVEGLYGVSVMPLPYADGANSALADWIGRYKQRFGAAPNIWSAMGYNVADVFIQGLEAAGPDLTAQRFVDGMESVHTTRDFFGSPEYRFSKTDHLGNRVGRLARIENGRWALISDYLQ